MHVDLGVLLGHCVHVRYDIKNLSEEVVKHIAPNKIVSGKVDLSSDRKTPRGHEISVRLPLKSVQPLVSAPLQQWEFVDFSAARSNLKNPRRGFIKSARDSSDGVSFTSHVLLCQKRPMTADTGSKNQCSCNDSNSLMSYILTLKSTLNY